MGNTGKMRIMLASLCQIPSVENCLFCSIICLMGSMKAGYRLLEKVKKWPEREITTDFGSKRGRCRLYLQRFDRKKRKIKMASKLQKLMKKWLFSAILPYYWPKAHFLYSLKTF